MSKHQLDAAASVGYEFKRLQASVVLADGHQLTLTASIIQKIPTSSSSLALDNYCIRNIAMTVTTAHQLVWTFVEIGEVKSRTILEPIRSHEAFAEDKKLFVAKGNNFILQAVSISVPHNISVFM